jgi:predicted DNA-binding transcriptional regulator YafY
MHLAYTDEANRESDRTVHPLGLYFWGNRWTLVAWCLARDDFRHFRLDRMRTVDVTAETFTHRRGRTLHDFLRKVRKEGAETTARGQ